MSAADLTRQTIVARTKELSAKKSFAKLSVIEITRCCGISRNTFYYYFNDKYAVVEWIFENELLPILQPMMTAEQWPESVVALCEHMKKEKYFYISALYDPNRHGLQQLLVDYYKNFLLSTAQPRCEALHLSGESQEIIARFYSHAVLGLICDWARAGMKKDADFATRAIRLAAKERLFT